MLTVIEDIPRIKTVWRSLQSEMLEGATRVRRKLAARSDQGSHPEHNLIVRNDLGIWTAPSQRLTSRFWTPFGTLPMKPKGSLQMVVQINPVIDRNVNQGSTSGILAVDEAGDEWICHTGWVNGRKKAELLEWSERPVETATRQGLSSIPVLPVARLANPDWLQDIADYVHEVSEFKFGSAPAKKTPKASKQSDFKGLPEENERTSKVRARDGYTMKRQHGVIRNRLKDLLIDYGLDAHRDGPRDIFVGPSKSPSIEFEVKSNSTSQSIFTAVGQLLIHSAMTPAKTKVAVLPSTLSSEAAKAIRSLGIQVVTFDMNDKHIVFKDLDKVHKSLPAKATCPVRKSRFAPSPAA